MRPMIDAHLDLAWNALQWNRDLTRPLKEVCAAEAKMTDHPARGCATVTLPEMRRGRVVVALGTLLARAKPDMCPPAGFSRRDLDYRTQSAACAAAQGQLAYYRELERDGHLRMLRTSLELRQHWQQWERAPEQTPLGLILAMEGADPIVTPQRAQWWWDNGLRCVGLAHYGQGRYAMGTGGEGPLTSEGRALLAEFERLGMVLDLTHCAEPGFHEALDRFSGAVLASHNMCRALVPGDRQFSDEQIRRLVARGGVIGAAFDAWMLFPGWKIGQTSREVVSLEAVADHIDHVCQIAGNAEHAAIGTDLDGGFGTEQTPSDLDSIADVHKLEAILGGRGYRADQIDAVFFGNWLRFFDRALPQD